jgi:hypothetical protein
MKPRYLALCALSTLPGACTTAPAPTTSTEGPVYGYLYYDATHPNNVSQTSPQAIYNATHGVWLWPPATNRGRS